MSSVSEKHETWRELGAVPIVVVVSAVVLAVLVGDWLGPWPAALVTVGFALTVIAGLAAWSARRVRPKAAEAPRARPANDRRFRILVVACGRWPVAGSIEELLSHAGRRRVSVFVTAPVLESRIGVLTGDQNGYDDATRRLKVTLDALRGAGLQTEGAVGPNDPLQAADDGVRRFPADEIVFITHSDGPTYWVEDGVIDLARSRYEAPVRHIAVH
jgi:hypothetical protein